MLRISLRFRRALALLLALPFVHGAAVAGHAPCESDRGSTVADHGNASAHAPSHAHHHLTAESDQAPGGPSAPEPSLPHQSIPSNACPMAMACATVAMATVVVPLGEEAARPVARQPLTHADRAPELAPHAPEPPPPRA